MNGPLVVAVAAALLGFGFWVWLTGPGTSVPNAVLALICGILFGRLGWWLATRGATKEDEPAPDPASPPPVPGRVPPDPGSSRKPGGRP